MINTGKWKKKNYLATERGYWLQCRDRYCIYSVFWLVSIRITRTLTRVSKAFAFYCDFLLIQYHNVKDYSMESCDIAGSASVNHCLNYIVDITGHERR